ncbi:MULTISPECIES: V-type ATP synthase subunit I [Enterococcus]|uniref:V-type ATP synthase subunit I n=1 Tax=Enterococcus TaxID=1350 RepID=UPI0010F6B21B|nr:MULTISPECIES: V-type ATP synthase subunit I [Enterococcus]KAF1301415.1 ATPase [Enterococcus sp. JM9B]
MAVSPLKKLSIIAEKEKQEKILQIIQGTQQLEIEDVLNHEENQTWIKAYFPEGSLLTTEDTHRYDQLLASIREGIQFIRNHGDAKQKIVELKRSVTTLDSLEATFDQEKILHLLEEINLLKDAWENNQQKEKTYLEAEDWGTDWQSLDIAPSESTLKTTTYVFGSIANEQWEELRTRLLENERFYFEIITTKPKETLFSLIYLKEEKTLVQNIFQHFGVKLETVFHEEEPKQVLAEAKQQLTALAKERKLLTKQIGEKKAQVADLQLAEEVLLAKQAREVAKQGSLRSRYLIVIRGWIAAADSEKITKKIQRAFPENEVYLSFEDPTKSEIAQNQAPTKLTNSKLVKPFEILTAMYSLPKYDEIDPTPWMMPFYLIFFGMMVADTGYGAVMLLITTLAIKFLTLPKGTMNFMKLFQLLSFPTIAWGLIYGSIFGADLPFHLLAPSKDFMAIFGISMIFGGLQIFTGLFLAARENIKRKDYLAAINEGFSWQGILAGILVAAAGSLVVKSSLMTTIGIIIAAFSALFVILIPMITSKSKVGGFFMGLYDLYGVTGYIGDFVSYSRLMALGISGGSIAAAFNMLVGYMPPAARFSIGILLLIALQGLNIFLSLLSAYVHAARLQYVEFFGKFYTGGGRPFQAFKPEEKYMNFEEENGGKDK